MFSKEESRLLRENFWISFGKSFPRKWILYDNKIKGLSFKFHFDNKSALVALDGPLDAIVFSAGIGEHSSEIRRRTLEKLGNILPHLMLDDERNEIDGAHSNGVISKDGCWPLALDIATNEEAMIAKECIRLVNDTPVQE